MREPAAYLSLIVEPHAPEDPSVHLTMNGTPSPNIPNCQYGFRLSLREMELLRDLLTTGMRYLDEEYLSSETEKL